MREFGVADVWFIVQAARWTLLLALVAFSGGAVGGLLVALARTSGSRSPQLAAAAFTQVFQGTPLLMQLFLVFFGAPVVGIEVSPWLAASVALILNTSAFLGDIWRGCIQAVPSGQWEAAQALGLRYAARMRRVILPQAWKIALPPTVGYLVQVLKGTSLAAVVGFTEITRAGQVVNNVTFQPLVAFSVVGALYFLLCWPLSWFARHAEARLKAATER